MENFPKFKNKINRIFGFSNENNVAIRIIQYLQQRKSIAEYATHFQQHAKNIDWDDNAFMTMLRRKLKIMSKTSSYELEHSLKISKN